LRQFGGKTGKDGKTLEEIIHLSVNESMKRSIYTSLTLLFVLLTVFFFGPDSIS
jgi:preprotein translocase subunit SecF